MLSKKIFCTTIFSIFCATLLAQGRYYEKEFLSTKLERKNLRQESSIADGGYLLFQGGLRKHPDSMTDDFITGGYGEYNGILGLNYGYRLSNASLETGLGFIWHYHRAAYFLAPAGENFFTYGNFNSILLPIVLKYDVPTGPSKKFRFGAIGSLNLLLLQTRNSEREGRGTYFFDYFDDRNRFVQYRYSWQSPRVSGFVKVGLYTEFQILGSSFLNLQFSRAIPAGSSRKVTYEWEFSGSKGTFTEDLKIGGYLLELAYKLPLNVLSTER